MHSATSLESGQGGISEKIRRPKANRGNSWDLLGERPEWEDFNPKNASVENLRFAQGDVGTNKVRSRRIRPTCFMAVLRVGITLMLGFSSLLLAAKPWYCGSMGYVHHTYSRYPLDPGYSWGYCYPGRHGMGRQIGAC